MKNISFILAILMLSLNQSIIAQNLIVVQNGNPPAFFITLDSAVFNASDGDTVFLPGGSFEMPISHIDKELHFIGIGYNSYVNDDSLVTIINRLNLKTGADNGSIEGIYVSGNVFFGDHESTLIGYTIKRCFINGNIYNYNSINPEYPLTNIAIIESSFDSFHGYLKTELCLIQNCIVRGLIYRLKNSLIQNCIFTHTINNNFQPISECYNCELKNSILHQSTWDSYYVGHNIIFMNNMNWLPNGIDSYGNYVNGNIYEELGNTFIDPDNGDYHLQSTSVGKNAGTDGTDLGIYGGVFPWKDGAVPFNPHIQTFQVSGTTDSTGLLNANIQLEAQDY